MRRPGGDDNRVERPRHRLRPTARAERDVKPVSVSTTLTRFAATYCSRCRLISASRTSSTCGATRNRCTSQSVRRCRTSRRRSVSSSRAQMAGPCAAGGRRPRAMSGRARRPRRRRRESAGPARVSSAPAKSSSQHCRHDPVPARPKSMPGKRRELPPEAPAVEARNHVGRGEALPDHQHAVGRPDRMDPREIVRIGDKARRGGDGLQRPRQPRLRMAHRQDDDIGGDDAPVRQPDPIARPERAADSAAALTWRTAPLSSNGSRWLAT